MIKPSDYPADAVGNLVVYVPGSAGREAEAPVIIQNHLDMVTVKTDDKEHNFSTDPLSLQVEEGWLLADRTTLGADNGIGCAGGHSPREQLEIATVPPFWHLLTALLERL